MKQTPLKRKTPLRAKTVSSRRKPISEASPAQRSKVRDADCIVTGHDRFEFVIHPAHLCSRARGGCDDPLCVVPLISSLHRDFDDGNFDLLPYLRPSGDLRRWLPEILHALGHYDGDLIALLHRLTGERYESVEATRLVGLENARRRVCPSEYGMAERVPTEKQYEALRSFRVGSWAVVSSGRLRQLMRWGWLAPEDPKKDDRFLHITPKGLRALADAVERYGFPPFPKGSNDA